MVSAAAAVRGRALRDRRNLRQRRADAAAEAALWWTFGATKLAIIAAIVAASVWG